MQMYSKIYFVPPLKLQKRNCQDIYLNKTAKHTVLGKS